MSVPVVDHKSILEMPREQAARRSDPAGESTDEATVRASLTMEM